MDESGRVVRLLRVQKVVEDTFSESTKLIAGCDVR
jgi:hypothetical protein